MIDAAPSRASSARAAPRVVRARLRVIGRVYKPAPRCGITRDLSGISLHKGRPTAAFFAAHQGPLKTMSETAAPKRPQAAGTRPSITNEATMLYALLAYHVEEAVASWTPQHDAALIPEFAPLHQPPHP